MSNPLFAIDAGHYIDTPGKRCLKSIDPGETREWVLNSRIADKVQERLRGYRCATMRVDDVTGEKEISLSKRVALANQADADLYLSFHHNAGDVYKRQIIENIREISRILDETDEHIIAKLQSEYFGIVAPYKNFTIDEIACIFTAYAFGHDEMAKEILDGHNAKIM